MCCILIVPCGHRLPFVYNSQMRHIEGGLLSIVNFMDYEFYYPCCVSCFLLCIRAMYGYIHRMCSKMEECMEQ